MRALIVHDIKNIRRALKIMGLVLFITLIIVVILRFTEDDQNMTLPLSLFIAVPCLTFYFGYDSTFRKLFSKRILKDCIANYTPTSKRVIILEPILYMLLYMLVSFLFTFVLLWMIFGGVQQALGTTPFLHNAGSFLKFTAQVSCITPFMILVYSSITLLLWGGLKVKVLKNKNRYEYVNMVAIFSVWIIIEIAQINSIPVLTTAIFSMILSIIFMAIYYCMSMNRNLAS